MRLHVVYITAAALAWIKAKPRARVLHQFNAAVNLVTHTGQVLSLVAGEKDRGPFSVVVSLPDGTGFRELFSPEAEVRTRCDGLAIGGLEIDLSAGELWDPSPPWNQIRAAGDQFAAQLPLIGAVIVRSQQNRNNSALPTVSAGLLDAELFDRTGVEFCNDLLDGDEARSRKSIRRLLGNGQGLTPSGDDFLLGALLAAHIFLPQRKLEYFMELVRSEAEDRTTLLSAAWLLAAADGECALCWHNYFSSITAGNTECIKQTLAGICAQGFSSGYDALQGFYTLAEGCIQRGVVVISERIH